MKLLSVLTPQGPRLAAKLPTGILIFSQAEGVIRNDGAPLPLTLLAALSADGGLENLLERLESIAALPEIQKFVVAEDEVEIDRPFLPRNVVCVGLNYRDHAFECKRPIPKEPILFAKWNSAMTGPGDVIVLAPGSSEVDYEAELALVIGKECRSVSAERALEYVAGYACANDVSARDFQRSDGQWVRAKSQDTFGPFGPYLVTRDEIADPQALSIRCSVNGRVLQESNTSEMIFSVRELIEFISRGITLHPGDLICTGTPKGIGQAQQPPVYLKAGDEVVVEIENLGRLANPVAAFPAGRTA
jgi:2-keto-4-pentenoate hydratase/2-oxohepta-3-ene-1,7-dioic acid hydratase in catechol pathway